MHLNEHTSEVEETQGVRYNVPTVIREEGFEKWATIHGND